MFTSRKPGISANDLKSVVCLALALSPALLIATAPQTAAAQSWLPSSNQFAYVANSGDNTVSGYMIDPVTGALTAIAGPPFLAGAEPNSSLVIS